MPRSDDEITPGRVIKWVALGVGGLLLLSGAGCVLQTATMPGRSAVGVLERTLDPNNVITTYERFHDWENGYNMRLNQIRATSRQLSDADPSERRYIRVELNAQRQSCREIVTNYNSDSAKTNRMVFRGRTLPENLDLGACDRE
jgi:hypothetical protein